MSGTHYALAGQIAERGFSRYAETFATQSEDERRTLEDHILDSAIVEAEVGAFRDDWIWDADLECYLQPA